MNGVLLTFIVGVLVLGGLGFWWERRETRKLERWKREWRRDEDRKRWQGRA